MLATKFECSSAGNGASKYCGVDSKLVRVAKLATLLFAALKLAAADSVTERLSYTVEWRLIHAGNAVIEAGPTSDTVKLESAGLVSTLYKIQDNYRVQFDSSFCAASSLMDAREGSRHRETAVTFDRNQNRAFLIEKDLVKNRIVSKTDVQIPNCAHDVITALKQLRRTKVDVGQTVQIPVSDGRKAAAVKIEAQEREQVSHTRGHVQDGSLRSQPPERRGVFAHGTRLYLAYRRRAAAAGTVPRYA